MSSLQVSRLRLVFLVLGSAALLGGCGAIESTPTPKPTIAPTERPTATATPAPTMTPVPQPLDLVVLHTNDVLGYTEPSGWGARKGGLARRASVIRSTRAEFANVLVLDAGNTVWDTRSPSDPAKSKLMIEAMNLMQYDAMTIGDLDLQLGPDVLQERMADANFPFLSANVRLVSDGELLAQPHVIRQFGERKVGIIGLTWDFGQEIPAGIAEQYILLKPGEVLARCVSELEEQTDIIIVLSNMGQEEDQHLSSSVPGIDLIVSGRSRVPMAAAWRNEQTGTIIVEAGSYGIYVGRRHLSFDRAGRVAESLDELLVLTPDYADDSEMLDLLGGQGTGGC